jgi:tetratricopeptide (TPR) repeat protein
MPHASPISITAASDRPPNPGAFRNFVEGMERFNNYLRSDNGEELQAATKAFESAANEDPSFLLARFHQAVAFAHIRQEDDAIRVFEELVFEAPTFLPEIYYNLAQAYLHTYRYAEVLKAEHAFDSAEAMARRGGRSYLVYLSRASKVLLYGVLGGRRLGHADDFQERKAKYLPAGERLGEEVLADRRGLHSLRKSEADDVRLEAHNGLGVVYMRMGQYAELLKKEPAEMWKSSEGHFKACLDIQPTLTPTLHNLGTLHRLEGHSLWRAGRMAEAKQEFSEAREYYVSSIRINRYDRFPYYGAAVCSVYVEDWPAAFEYLSIGQKQRGQVRKELWELLEKSISLKDPDVLASEEAGEA